MAEGGGPEAGPPDGLERFREMGITHREFLRSLPAVLEGDGFSVSGREIVSGGADRRVTIHLAPEDRRRIGALSLPVTRVEFLFHGYASGEVDSFMDRFDFHFRRGGG